MKVALDQLTSATGWSGPAGSSFTLNQHADYISEYLGNSLIIHIPAGSLGQSFSKSIGSVDVSKCSEIVLSVWSRELKRVRTNTPSDYFYTIQFDATHQFMMQTNLNFESDTFGINGWTSADRITITPTSNNEDWLIISGCYAIWDDFPLDILQGVQLGIQQAVNALLPNGYPIGTVSCAAGSASIAPSSLTYLERGAVVYISDGANSETHQVGRFDEGSGLIFFTDLYDGSTMKYSHATVQMSLSIPVLYGVQQQEAALPSISIWGMVPKNNQDTQDTFIVEDSIGPTGAASLRRMPWMQTFDIIVDCEARHSQVLAMAARCARMFLASSRVWINGRANEMPYPEDPVYVEPVEGTTMIPKIRWVVAIEVHEERALRSWVGPVLGQTFTYTQELGKLSTVDP